MLKISGLYCGYDKKNIIKDISFSIPSGAKLCVLGKNGCGKSTLLRAIAGVIKYTGEISINGVKLNGLSQLNIAKNVALLSQISTVNFDYTVYDTVAMGYYAQEKKGIFDVPSAEKRKIVETAMQTIGVWQMKDKNISQLSGGQLQRVFLARTFVQSTNVILLDEPTNHLDLKYQIELVEKLKQWTKEKNINVVAVFHDINLALDFADYILLLDAGKMIDFSSKEDFDVEKLNNIYKIDVKLHMRNSLKRWEN